MSWHCFVKIFPLSMELDWSFDMMPVTMTMSMIIVMTVAGMGDLGGQEYWLFEGVIRFVIMVRTTIFPFHKPKYYRIKTYQIDKTSYKVHNQIQAKTIFSNNLKSKPKMDINNNHNAKNNQSSNIPPPEPKIQLHSNIQLWDPKQNQPSYCHHLGKSKT